MIGGSLALGIAVKVIYLITGKLNGPLGLVTNPFLVVWLAVKQGWPGIVIQLALIPVIIWLVGKLVAKT